MKFGGAMSSINSCRSTILWSLIAITPVQLCCASWTACTIWQQMEKSLIFCYTLICGPLHCNYWFTSSVGRSNMGLFICGCFLSLDHLTSRTYCSKFNISYSYYCTDSVSDLQFHFCYTAETIQKQEMMSGLLWVSHSLNWTIWHTYYWEVYSAGFNKTSCKPSLLFFVCTHIQTQHLNNTSSSISFTVKLRPIFHYYPVQSLANLPFHSPLILCTSNATRDSTQYDHTDP